MLRFPEKTPEETPVAQLDFTNRLTADRTIMSARTEVALYSGQDDDPDNLLDGDPVVNGAIVFQPLKAGVAGANYMLRFIATLSDGLVIEEEGLVPVVQYRRA